MLREMWTVEAWFVSFQRGIRALMSSFTYRSCILPVSRKLKAEFKGNEVTYLAEDSQENMVVDDIKVNLIME